MNTITYLKSRRKGMPRLLLLSVPAYGLFFFSIIGAGFFFNIPPDYLTKDPVALLHGKFYTGALSNFTILCWTAAATLCMFGYLALYKFAPRAGLKPLLFHFALVTLLLLLDDLYLWHEVMFPDYMGVNERLVYLSYLLYIAFILVRFRNVIFQTEYVVLACAFFFLGASMTVDVCSHKLIHTLHMPAQWETLLEDALKSIGVFTWMVYFIRVAFADVLLQVQKRSIRSSPVKQMVNT